MPGKPVPIVKLQLDKARHLRLDLNAMVEFEEETGFHISEANTGKMSILRALLWACLLHEDADLSVEQVGAMIHAGNMAEVGAAVGKAMSAAAPVPDPDAPKNPGSLPTGSNSGASGDTI